MADARIPRERNEPRLKEGMIIAFSISLEGTGSQFRKVPQVRQALAKLTSKKYLGIITFTEVHTRYLYWKSPKPNGPPPLELTGIMPMSLHPPTIDMYPREYPYLDVPRLCVPIHTSYVDGHRPPLELAPRSRLFPLEGAFAFTAYPKELVILHIHRPEADDAWIVADSDQERWDDCVQDDMYLVSKAFDQERKDHPRPAAEIPQPTKDEVEEAEVEAILRVEPWRFRMPLFDIIYDVWLDFDRDDVLLDPQEHGREVMVVRQ